MTLTLRALSSRRLAMRLERAALVHALGHGSAELRAALRLRQRLQFRALFGGTL